jgi:cytochrome P450
MWIMHCSGEDWSRQHRILYKAFVPKLVHSFAGEMEQVVLQSLVPKLEQAIISKKPVTLLAGKARMRFLLSISRIPELGT